MTQLGAAEFHGNQNEVELTGSNQSESPFYIDYASHKHMTYLMFILIGYLLLHIVAGYRSPPLFTSKNDTYSVTTSNDSYSVELFVGLSKLLPGHRFIDVYCNLLRENVTIPDKKEVDLDIQITSKNFIHDELDKVYDPISEKHHYTVDFKENEMISTPFSVYKRFRDYKTRENSIEIQANIFTNYSSISGFYFQWNFPNPAADKFYHSTNLLLSLLIFYMLIVFSSFLTLKDESYTEISCIVLGISGGFACNFFYVFIYNAYLIELLDTIFAEIFIGVFNFFIITQLYLFSHDEASMPRMTTFFYACLFGCFSLFDAISNYYYEKSWKFSFTPEFTLTFSKKILIAFYFFYCIGLLIHLITLRNKMQTKRGVFIMIMVLISIIASFISNVIAPLTHFGKTTIFSKVFLLNIYLSSTSFILFMLRPDSGIDYKQVDENMSDEIQIDIDENQMEKENE